MNDKNYDSYDSLDEANMDEMKRITHILEQAKNMCEGTTIDFKGINKFSKVSIPIENEI